MTGGFSIYHLIKLRKHMKLLEKENRNLKTNQVLQSHIEADEIGEIELIDK